MTIQATIDGLKAKGYTLAEILENWDGAGGMEYGPQVPSIQDVPDPVFGGEFPAILWRPTTKNRKTGDIPTAHIGESVERSRKSCAGCPLLSSGECYSQNGTPRMGLSSMERSIVKNSDAKRYGLKFALAGRVNGAKYARFTAIGDGARANPVEVRVAEKRVRAEGLGWLAYTHFPAEVAGRGDQDLFCASVNELSEADNALAMGFNRVTVVLPWDFYKHNTATFETPGGEPGLVCPALLAHSKGRRLTCNECGKCDPTAPGVRVIGFVDHSKKATAKLKKLAAEGVQWAVNLCEKL